MLCLCGRDLRVGYLRIAILSHQCFQVTDIVLILTMRSLVRRLFRISLQEQKYIPHTTTPRLTIRSSQCSSKRCSLGEVQPLSMMPLTSSTSATISQIKEWAFIYLPRKILPRVPHVSLVLATLRFSVPVHHIT